MYKYHISLCYQLTFAFTGYYVYLSGELEMNSLLLKIVYTLLYNLGFFYCHTKKLFKSADVILLFEAGIKAMF